MNQEKLCSYLKYWIYDQLVSEKVTDKNFSIFFNLWNERKNKCPSCDCEFNITRFTEAKQLKKVYDYSLFLKVYKNIAKINKHISKMYYCNYIEKAKVLRFLLLEFTCKENEQNKEFCDEFNKYVRHYINDEDLVIDELEEEDEHTEGDGDTENDENDTAISCDVDLTKDPRLTEDFRKAKEIVEELAAGKKKEQ
ncbi:hypothetical protein PCYB_001890 [Plasmodium cynomolgi strain B]|uniref:Uncharacterized protein n=1 Tax=Plasmodium cynomolgi (strain B) TaxID=1120755 RepID=K6UF41_PLACD|nr:hypothetical protein PCYB_001890 [Plasmodium cynomolgi strain B]GAB69441.1 hypothetical protein PCYB_001890 [Plasmodium cynomolgi strain B]